MIPLRLVIDTNLVVSAILKPDGLPRTVLLLATTPPARWYVSKDILLEYRDVLARPELRIQRSLQLQMMQLIRNCSYSVEITCSLHITSDPADNKFLECADAARADYLVTGNQRHFPLYWKKTKMISLRDFIALVAPHLLA
jgi:uncharacterized protein